MTVLVLRAGAQVWMQKHLKIVVPMVLGRWGSPVPFRKRLVVEVR